VKKIIFLLILLCCSTGFASNCSEMNLITEEESPFQKIPVYDQDGIGICYAYSASQLIDYHIIKAGGERSVHPLWAALRYAEERKQSFIAGGDVPHAVKGIKRVGNCSYDKIENALKVWAQKANATEAEVMGLIEKLALGFKEKRDLKQSTAPESATLSDDEVNQVIRRTIVLHEVVCSPKATWKAIVPELKALSNLTSQKFLEELVLPVCDDSISKLDIPDPLYFFTQDNSVYISTIQDKLESLKAPLSISYCSKVLKDPSFAGATTEKRTGDCGQHESIIVGKKIIGESCHFLLRNTWGTGFNTYTKGWKCLCKNRTSGALVDNCEATTHNTGEYTVEACWIDANKLSKNIIAITTLESKSEPDKE
jgi:hypothetical protein